MPGNAAQLQAECARLADSMRRLPPELRRALASDVAGDVGGPIANRVQDTLSGPYAHAIAGAVTVDISPDPLVRIDLTGGPVLSGGATVQHLVYGVEHGGGRRVSRVSAGRGHRAYKRKGTNQFVPARPFWTRSIDASRDAAFDVWTDLVDQRITKGLNDGR